MSATFSQLNRRSFLKAGAATAGGLLIGFQLPESNKLEAAPTEGAKLNAYIHVGSDDMVTFEIAKSEMGQGPQTSLSQILAEELDCDWKQIRTEFAPVDPAYGPLQGTFGSMSIRTSLAAAAQSRRVGSRNAAGGRRAEMGRSKVAASHRARVRDQHSQQRARQLRQSRRCRWQIARACQSRAERSQGFPPDRDFAQAARHASQGERHGRVRHRCPAPGHGVRGARTLPGIRRQGRQLRRIQERKPFPACKQVVQISRGVAVIADNTWSAMEGRRALQVQFDEGKNANLSSASIRELFVNLAAKPGRRGSQRWRCGSRAGERREEAGSRLRSALSIARSDGADELHRRRAPR